MYFLIYRSDSSEDVCTTSDAADETHEEDLGLANKSVDDKSANL